MKQMLQYLKAYKKESIIAPLFKMLEASFELLVPIVMANIIDVGIQNGDKPYIWRMCALMIALGVLGLVWFPWTAQYFAAKAAMGFGTALRKALFGHINSLSYNELDQIGTPTLITRMTSDINRRRRCQYDAPSVPAFSVHRHRSSCDGFYYQRKTDDHFPDCSTVNRTGNLSDYAYHCTDL